MEVDLGNEHSVSIMPVPINNSEVLPVEEPTIANDLVVTLKNVKVNGDTKGEDSDKVDSSDCDTLVIDEKPSVIRKRKLLPFELQSGFKGFKRLKTDSEFEPPTNPYFNESLFELSGLHHNEKHSVSGSTDNYNTEGSTENAPTPAAAPTVNCKKGNTKKKKLGSPKLREYAQYLGLQPTVQFKCSRCAQSGFPSLTALNEHHNQCTAQGPIAPPMSTTSSTAPSTNFRVTRKVFLCSACGTYYENWNLFLHMREVHKRFICLYCLGMFSQPEKLSLHLVSKHNCVPNQLNSEEDFFQIYKDPCFLMCCECETVFGESDNFFNHQCSGKVFRNINENKSKVTNNTTKPSQKINVKNNKLGTKKSSFVEHVTGDTQFVCNENDNLEIKTPTEDNLENTSQPDVSLQASETNLSQNENQVGDLQEFESQNNLKTDFETMETNSENVDNEKLSEEIELDDTKTNDTMLKNPEQETKESVTEDENEEESNKSTESKSRTPSPFESPNFEEASLPLNYEERLKDIDEFLKSNELEQQEETRKVPKVTLKLPKLSQPYVENGDSDDSEKLTMEVDSMDCENHSDNDNEFHNSVEDEKEEQPVTPEFPVAGPEVPIIELGLEQPLDKFDVKILLQKCLKETVLTCTYCNHARKIAVNGKQLGLHAIAEHRFSAVVNSITAEELIPESFVMRIKEGFPELETSYFSIESNTTDEGVTFSHVFECFQCRYATTVHKELYLHNRKMHAKTILLCIMCKSNFYSYSELICHLCPGVYVGMELNNDISFRCCMCITDDLPSAFRLMVHLRKRHHACDVCLELCNNQSKLSNHVWKHKLHHLCYRCGIAYRNKPDITKHLFWKHGTESVLCKKCLQKKWPHVYHFCIPPSTFTCEECNLIFSKAVSLKVHKRLHSDSKPHTCTFENCLEKFISKKLLLKHEFKHREPPEEEKVNESLNESVESKDPSTIIDPLETTEEVSVEVEKEEVKPKPKVDVYDLPELNLSESDSSDSETEEKCKVEPATSIEEKIDGVVEVDQGSLIKSEETVEVKSESKPLESLESSVPVLHNIWDDFKNYQASKTKTDTPGLETEMETQPIPSTSVLEQFEEQISQEAVLEVINKDHDYCISNRDSITETKPNPVERTQSMDHDYCFSNSQTQEQEQPTTDVIKPKSPVLPDKKETKPNATSDSSDDSDSSSCECNSNCSCSSTSGSSSSSSDSSDSDSSSSEGRRKQQARRERRRRMKSQKGENKERKTAAVVAPVETIPAQPQTEQQIEESDLYTTESETDEDFYDQQPQKLANKLLAEKRKLLLAGISPFINGSVLESSRPSTPSLPETEEVKPKKKSKSKKKKKKNKKNKSSSIRQNIPSSSYQYQYQPSGVSPLTLSFPKLSPNTTPIPPTVSTPHSVSNSMTYPIDDHGFDLSGDNINSNDLSLRASKRRRIPNRFYGYSSEEEHDKYQPPVLKWRKADLPSPVRQPSSPLTVPPITIKNIPAFVPEEPIVSRSPLITNEVPNIPFQRVPPTILTRPSEPDSGTETNDSSSEEEQPPPHQPPHFLNKPPNQPTLYCYCRCPYDEVSEMIGCDSDDCMIEWFHFECVGIMVPPKGQWYCPDCRKKKLAEKERLALGQV